MSREKDEMIEMLNKEKGYYMRKCEGMVGRIGDMERVVREQERRIGE